MSTVSSTRQPLVAKPVDGILSTASPASLQERRLQRGYQSYGGDGTTDTCRALGLRTQWRRPAFLDPVCQSGAIPSGANDSSKSSDSSNQHFAVEASGVNHDAALSDSSSLTKTPIRQVRWGFFLNLSRSPRRLGGDRRTCTAEDTSGNRPLAFHFPSKAPDITGIRLGETLSISCQPICHLFLQACLFASRGIKKRKQGLERAGEVKSSRRIIYQFLNLQHAPSNSLRGPAAPLACVCFEDYLYFIS